MKTSYKKTEKLIQNTTNNNPNLNITPFTPRKQLNFTSNKAKKYDISCSQREQDRENLKNNLLLTYIESQNCPEQINNNQISNHSSKKEKSKIIINQKQNMFSKQISNKLIVSKYLFYLTVNLFFYKIKI
jgi:hypothetical protein